MRFGREVVDRVDDEIGLGREELRAALLVVELARGFDLAGRVHEPEALGHHVDLSFADRALHRVKLTVRVRDADLVEVDEDDRADAGAREGLRGEAAHTADADDHHARAVEARETALAEEPRRAIEAPVGAKGGLDLVRVGLDEVDRRPLGKKRVGAFGGGAQNRKRHGGDGVAPLASAGRSASPDGGFRARRRCVGARSLSERDQGQPKSTCALAAASTSGRSRAVATSGRYAGSLRSVGAPVGLWSGASVSSRTRSAGSRRRPRECDARSAG